jgi:hypothetical protein
MSGGDGVDSSTQVLVVRYSSTQVLAIRCHARH